MELPKSMLPLTLLVLALTPSVLAQAPSYLDNLSMPFPVDSTQVRTTRPLAPYITYRIRLTSPSDLRHIYQEYPEGYSSYVVIDGQLQKAAIFGQESDGFVNDLEFVYRGSGRPITIGLSENREKLIDSVQLEITVETWFQRLWREQLRGIWTSYGSIVIISAFLLPLVILLLFFYFRRTDRLRAEEFKAEAARRTFLLESHNKRIEVMREIDRRAQERANELFASKNYDLQKKIMYWKTKAYTESYFLNHEMRHQYAYANRDRIISELEKEWAEECLEIAQDIPLITALREQEPGVMHWIQARQEVVYLAHNMAWKEHKVIDAYFEEVPETEIIIADEIEAEENNVGKKSPRSKRMIH